MRIAHVLHGWPPQSMGGTGLYVDALAKALAEAGHTVAIAAPVAQTEPDGLDAHLDTVEGWRFRVPPARRWSETWNRPNLGKAWQAWCEEWRPDVVHIHHLSGWPLDLVERTPARTVLTLHDYAIPCARGQWVNRHLELCDGPSAARCADCLREHLQLNPVTAFLGRLLEGWPVLRSKARTAAGVAPRPGAMRAVDDRLAAARSAIEAADHLLSPSDDLCDRIEAFTGRRPDRTHLPLLRAPLTASAPEPGPIRFLFASAIIPTKGPDRLVEAFAELGGDHRLTITGHTTPIDGHPTFARDLEARAAEVPGIAWLGATSPESIPALMAQHDVLVLPSRWPENSPLVVREATAAGLRIVLGQHGGAHELAPLARIAPDRPGALTEALQAEVALGRSRVPAQAWPTPEEHAATLLDHVYCASTYS